MKRYSEYSTFYKCQECGNIQTTEKENINLCCTSCGSTTNRLPIVGQLIEHMWPTAAGTHQWHALEFERKL